MTNSSPTFTILSEHKTFRASLKKMLQEEEGFSSDININCNRLIRNTELVILDLHSRDKVEKYAQALKDKDFEKIPFTIVLGIEQNLDYYDRLFLSGLDDRLGPIRLLTHACGRKYYHYFSLLDDKSRLIAFLKKKVNDNLKDDRKSLKLKNPFKEISKVEELQKNAPSTDFFVEAGKYTVPEHRRKQRLREFHVKEDVESLLALQFYDLAVACVKHNSQIRYQNEKNRFNVLLIENNPHGPIKELKNLPKGEKDSIDLTFCLKKIETLFDGYKFWIYPKEADYQSLRNMLNSMLDDQANRKNLETEIFRRVKPIDDTTNKANHKNGDLTFKNIDLILIDIFLDEGATLSGLDFLRLFTTLYPEIPAFILSVSEDTEVITETIKGKADYYILKKNIFSLPFLFYEYLSDLGILINYISNRNLRRNLIGNIRYWRFNNDLLGFGDKCYHMINHSFAHVSNDWKLLNQLFVPLIKFKGKSDLGEKNVDENLYCLSMAVWLHDIGHRGNERYGAAHEIRENHGIISGEFILKQVEFLGIVKKEGSEAYKDINFPFGPQRKPVTQVIMENIKEKVSISIVEKIALISIYHKSNSPIDSDEYRQLVNKGKYIPIDFFEGSNRKNKEITLDDILSCLEGKDKDIASSDKEQREKNKSDVKALRMMVSLFRFIDAIDINRNRVGSENEGDLKKCIIKQDKEYQLSRLEKEIKSIIQQNQTKRAIDPLDKLALMKIFYQDVREKIEKGDSVSHLELPELAPDISEELDSYFLLAKYASFISVQDGHFDLHSSIKDVSLSVNESTERSKMELSVSYQSCKDWDYLKGEKIVRDPGDKESKTVVERLIGTEKEQFKDGYMVREYESSSPKLKDLITLKAIRLFANGDKDKPSLEIKNDVTKWIEMKWHEQKNTPTT